MNTKQEAKKELQCYKARKVSAVNLESRMRALDRQLENADESSREELSDRRRRFGAQLECVNLWLGAVENALGTLSREEKLTLERFFIDRQPGWLMDLCEELFLEQAAIYKLKDRALRKFALAMYGGEEI